jgi:UDP-N-acetylglucosamine 2-epimerase (non-hydrolysing)
MALCLEGLAPALAEIKPDMALILGDRYEMLAVAAACAVMTIPIVHIAGGEVSEGAVDDSIRHAITKLSALHLTATEPYRQRVIQMGEHPQRVINTGAIGVWNILNTPLMSADELAESLDGFYFDRSRTLLVTYHPATLDDNADPLDRFNQLLEALDRFPDSNVLITYPNNDARGNQIIERIEQYAAADPQRVKAVKSLGMRRYLSAVKLSAAVVGNSSSGIVEVPSLHRPTVDIGIRQRGRLAADSVIHCDDNADAIADAIAFAISPQGQQLAATAQNPYYKPDTLDIMVNAIVNADPLALRHKTFYDLPDKP